MKPAPGETLGGGRYRLRRRLGAGGMASVWLGIDERLDRPVAIKIVADTLAGDEAWVTRFTREARAAAGLSHRGVVPVFDHGVEDGRPYLVMEYVSGGTLADRPAAAAARPSAASLARELLEALDAVHAAGILHRDVKPANLLLDERGHVRLTDFGIAQVQDSTGLTRTGMVIGTLRYLAPEVADGGSASAQSDLYAAGVVIREICGGDPPPPLDRIVAALTAPDPRERPASAAAAIEMLDAASTAATPPRPLIGRAAPSGELTALTAALRSPSDRRLARRGVPRGPAYGAAILGVVVIIIVIVAAGGGSGPSRTRPPAPAPANAPIARQVRALDHIIQSATQP